MKMKIWTPVTMHAWMVLDHDTATMLWAFLFLWFQIKRWACLRLSPNFYPLTAITTTTTMYTTSYLCASDLNRFMMRRTIQELELDDGPARFHIDDIEEHSDNRSPSQHQTMDPVFMPSYFSSMLSMNHADMWKISRPMTHELASPDDEIIWSTRRTQHTRSGA